MKLDVIDLKILEALQKNSKITNIELSKIIGLSAAPTLGRVQKLEKSHSSEELTDKVKTLKDDLQLSFFNLDDPLLENIKEEILHIDIDTLTPVEALMKLNEIKRMLAKEKRA